MQIDAVRQDLHYALRRLRKSPGFTAVAALTLALGIGANAGIFSLINAVLLRPPEGVAAPDRLAVLYTSDFGGEIYSATSWADFQMMRQLSGVIQDAAAVAPRPFSLSEGRGGTLLFGEEVSGNYFDVLGVRPVLGRAFTLEEGTRGGPPAIVLSHGLWQRRFGADPGVPGRTVNVNGTPFTIIGVAPEHFSGMIRGLSADLWVSIPQIARTTDYEHRGNRRLLVLARLQPNATVDATNAALAVLAQQIVRAYPEDFRNRQGKPRTLSALPESEARLFPMIRGPVLAFLTLLMCVVAIVLLIACANLANLLLARASAREKEVAIRLALGASRRRLVSQLLIESLILATLGGVLGLAIAAIGLRLVPAVSLPFGMTLALDLSVDVRVVLFTAAATLGTAVLFGLAPAMQSTRPDLTRALKNDSRVPVPRRVSLRSMLVVAEVAGSIVLLVGAGLFVRTLYAAQNVNPGFRTERLLLAPMMLHVSGYDEPRSRDLYGRLLERLSAQSGVESVSSARSVPLGLAFASGSVAVESYTPAQGEDMEFGFNSVGAGYFETMGIALVRGRGFDAQDAANAPGVAIVNEAFAARFWPGQNPIGKRISRGPGASWLEVVGIASNSKVGTIGEVTTPHFYRPLAQDWSEDQVVIVRTRGEPSELASVVRAEIQALDPALPVPSFVTMDQQIGLSLLPQRVAAAALGSMGGVGLILAILGVYGVMAYLVSQRTREIGIRVAIGARHVDILKLVVGQGMRLALTGIALGVLVSAGVAKLIERFLYGAAMDALTFAAVPALLLTIALLASYVPARRALRVDPVRALRME